MNHKKADGTKPTAAETRHFEDMVMEMRALQSALESHSLELSTPSLWEGLDEREKIAPEQARLSLLLDYDVIRWFRKTGPGYSRRINQVLRIYMSAVMSGQIQTHHHDQSPVSIFSSTQPPK